MFCEYSPRLLLTSLIAQFILQNAVGLSSRVKLTINVYLSPRNAMVSMIVLTVQMKLDAILVSIMVTV